MGLYEKLVSNEESLALVGLGYVGMPIAHDEFKEMGLEGIGKLYRDCTDGEKVLIDVKGIYKVDDLKKSGMQWWRL